MATVLFGSIDNLVASARETKEHGDEGSAKALEAALDRSKVVAADQLFDEAVAVLPPVHRAKFKKDPKPAPQPDDVDRVDDADLDGITDHD